MATKRNGVKKALEQAMKSASKVNPTAKRTLKKAEKQRKAARKIGGSVLGGLKAKAKRAPSDASKSIAKRGKKLSVKKATELGLMPGVKLGENTRSQSFKKRKEQLKKKAQKKGFDFDF